MSTPRLTVLMPVYNAEVFVRVAIESILNQTYLNFELLIINDGSTDNSGDIISRFHDPRIHFIDRQINLGLIDTLNEGIPIAKGDVIVRVDADDVCDPLRFEKQVTWLDAHPEVGVLGSYIRLIDADNNLGNVVEFPEGNALIRWAMYFYSAVSHPAVMIRKNVLEKLGGYRSFDENALDIFSIEDYDLWFRALAITKLYNLPEPLTIVRKHSGNITKIHIKRHMDNAERLAQKMIGEVLGFDIAIDAVRRLRALYGNGEYFSVKDISLYKRLLQEFISMSNFSRKEERLIRRDASRKLLKSWRKLRPSSHIPLLLSNAFIISPSATLRFGREKLWSRIRTADTS